MRIFLGVSFSTPHPPIIRGKDLVHGELDIGLSGLDCCSIFPDTLDKDLESWHVTGGILPDQLHSRRATFFPTCYLLIFIRINNPYWEPHIFQWAGQAGADFNGPHIQGKSHPEWKTGFQVTALSASYEEVSPVEAEHQKPENGPYFEGSYHSSLGKEGSGCCSGHL